LNAAVSRPSNRTSVLPELNSRQLAAVLAVSEFRSFIAAAAHLGVSQPAITLIIKRLERTLGMPLFLRSTRQITPTAAGREFVAMAERVLTDLKLGLQSLHELAEQRRGQVIVSSLPPLTMSSVIAEYTQRFPGVEIQLREGFQDAVRDDVRSGLADFGMGELGDLPESHLNESLGTLKFWLIMRDDHPLARRRKIEISALQGVALVSFGIGSTARRLIDAAATAHGFALHHAVVVNLPFTLMNLVAAGAGAAVVPSWHQASFPKIVARPLVGPQLSSEIGIFRLRDRELSPAAASLHTLARERLRIRGWR
jgi:DNA-binding transcriptional LysR family regulator